MRKSANPILGALETASFKLLATEGGIAATEAEHGRLGFGLQNDILFLGLPIPGGQIEITCEQRGIVMRFLGSMSRW